MLVMIRLAFHILFIKVCEFLAQCRNSLFVEHGIRQLHFLLCRIKGELKTCRGHFPTIGCLHPQREPRFEEHSSLVSRLKVELKEECGVGIIGS